MTFDADGNVLSVTVAEPRFTAHEKMLLLLARREAMEPRGPHGIKMSEAIDPANYGKFHVPNPTTDLAAKAEYAAKESWKKKWGDQAHMEDKIFRVELRD